VKVLVAGAAGFLGLAAVRALTDQGAEVIGLVRSAAQGPLVTAAGGAVAIGDVLEPATLERASIGCDGIVHLAATHPGAEAAADRAYEVRVEGTRNLIRAARSRGVRRIVIGSGYWVYRSDPGVISEDSPLDPRGESRNNFEAERAGLAANSVGGLEVVVARPGMVYGDGAWFRSTWDAIGMGSYRLVGDATNHWSFVSRVDTGAAFALLVARGRPGEVYNVVDGHPTPWREFIAFVASCRQRPLPESVTFEEAVLENGPDVAYHLVANRAASAKKLEALGWVPRYPSFREGLAELLPELR